MKHLLILLFCLLCVDLSAQFYYSGRGSAKIKWQQVDKDEYRLLYPEGYTEGASRYVSILDSIYPYVNYKFSKPIRKIPIILRTENQLSNGYVVWAPKHEELVTNPMAAGSYALSWDKQVALHEARHVAQMSLMKTGLTKVATWLLGEAGISVGLLVVSKWQLEGDATLAETQFAEYGRGLQPEFTLGYRGLAADGKLNFKMIDPWVSGSYRHYVPDIYQYGYQVMSAAESYCSPTIWNDVVTYSAKYPILISPRTFYLHKHYKTTYKKIAQRAFAELDSIWKPSLAVENNFRTITPLPKLHTNYTNPMAYKNSIVATKWDMKRPSRFVVIDTATMAERMIHPLGSVSSRPVIADDKIYWTEFKPDIFWEQKNSSIIRSLDLNSGRSAAYDRRGVNYFVTPVSDTTFATITMDDQSNSYIRVCDRSFKHDLATYKFESHTTLHSLTWDSLTRKLYFIALDDRGMWIGGVDNSGQICQVTYPSVVTVRDLRADCGKLYFSSIQSGKDEIHTIDLSSTEQYRQTLSRLGSVSPEIADDKTMLFSTYTPRGWAIARGSVSDTATVEWSRLPTNILNPPRYKWSVPKLDTMKLIRDTVAMEHSKRFRRALRTFNVHSWAPIAFDGSMLLGDRNSLNLAFGVSAFFQSTLSEMRGYATYGLLNNSDWVKAGFIYAGLPVEIELNAEYGGGYQFTYLPVTHMDVLPTKAPKPYFGIGLNFSLPMDLSRGAHKRMLRPSFAVNHTNARYYYSSSKTFGNDVRTYSASLSWSSIQAKGYRSLQPRLGYVAQASVYGAFHGDFSTIVNFTSRGYLPGFMQTHSLIISGATQYQFEKNNYKLTAKSLVPRGIVNNYAAKNYLAASVNYVMPLAYPEWGWDGMLFFRRISAEVFFDNSIGSYYDNNADRGLNIMKHYSGGIVLNIDTNLLRTLPNTLSFTFARSTQANFWFGFNIAFAI